MKKAVVEHIADLRKVLINSLIIFAISSLVAFIFSGEIVRNVVDFYIAQSNVRVVAIYPLEPIYARIETSLLLALFFSFPAFARGFFSFIGEGVDRETRKKFKGLFIRSLLLFYIGSVFSLLVLMKVAIWFMSQMALMMGVENYWSISGLLSFIFLSTALTGLSFELPLAINFLLSAGIVEKEELKSYRPFAVVFFMVLSAIITPPDILTQLMVALPLILLYEAGIIFSKDT